MTVQRISVSRDRWFGTSLEGVPRPGYRRAFGAHPPPKTVEGTSGSFHSLATADLDGEGDLDVLSGIWGIGTRAAMPAARHVDWLENRSRHQPPGRLANNGLIAVVSVKFDWRRLELPAALTRDFCYRRGVVAS
jgi:hypothetical protein